MGKNAILRGAGYFLAAVPDMVLHNGTTQTTERAVNPDSEYLVKIGDHLRNYEEVISYAPNQVYIGNMTPDQLGQIKMPWHDKKIETASRYGKYGEIMPQDEFIGMMQICDVFDLVHLEVDFATSVREKLAAHPLVGEERANILSKNTKTGDQIKALVNEDHAEGLYNDRKLVGAVKRAHDIDVNLSAHVLFENLVSKASSVLSLLHLL